MCNILTIKRNMATTSLRNPLSFLQHATGYAYVCNSDGEGAYFSQNREEKDEIQKSTGKIDYMRHSFAIRASAVIVTHQRMATSGFSEKYIHPFANDDFILVHNGVVSSLATDGKESDTSALFRRFCQRFAEAKGERDSRTIEAIKSTFDDLGGSWSVVIHDRKDGRTFYMKESSTRINAYRGDGVIILCTLEISPLLPGKLKDFPLLPYRIYELTEDADIIERGRIKEGSYSPVVPLYPSDYGFSRLGPAYTGEWSGMSHKKGKKHKRQKTSTRTGLKDRCGLCFADVDVEELSDGSYYGRSGLVCRDCARGLF